MDYRIVRKDRIDEVYFTEYEIDGETCYFVPRYGFLNKDLSNISDKILDDFAILQELKRLRVEEKISLVSLVITPACNGGCTYCYASQTRTNKKPKIDYEKIISSLLEVMDKNEVKMLQFFGGEPLLELDFIKSIKPVKDTQREIVTGLQIEESVFMDFIKYAKTQKYLTITVSIDPLGSTEWTRGDKKLYQKLLNRLKILQENGIEFSIRSTLTFQCYEISDLVEEIENKLGKEIHWGIGVVHGKDERFILIDEQKQNISEAIYAHNKQLLKGTKSYIPSPLSSFISIYKKSGDLFHNIYGLCTFGGRGGVTIDWNGEFRLCPEEATLKTPIEKSYYIQEGCKNCDYLMSCGGICLWNTPEQNKDWCWLMQMTIDHAVPMTILSLKKNSFQPDNRILIC